MYVEPTVGSTPLTGIVPSSRSRFFPRIDSGLALIGAETVSGGCDWTFNDVAVDEGLGTVELGLGTTELGRGTAEEGCGLGVAIGLGVDDTEDGILGVTETPLCAERGWATVSELKAAAVCIAAAAWACWAFARRLSSFYKYLSEIISKRKKKHTRFFRSSLAWADSTIRVVTFH